METMAPVVLAVSRVHAVYREPLARLARVERPVPLVLVAFRELLVPLEHVELVAPLEHVVFRV